MTSLDRKRPAHGVHSFPEKPTIVFVTTCTENRVRVLASPLIEKSLREVWSKAAHWRVGRYVLMPDHIHFFAAMTNESGELELWMKYWKRLFHSAHPHSDWHWQSGHWDTRMRTPQHYQEKWDYVLNNPVRHGLVTKSEGWPYQGQLFDSPWD